MDLFDNPAFCFQFHSIENDLLEGAQLFRDGPMRCCNSTHQLFKANIRGPQVHEGQYDRLLSGIPTLFTSVLVA